MSWLVAWRAADARVTVRSDAQKAVSDAVKRANQNLDNHVESAIVINIGDSTFKFLSGS
jgi:hypothetical protein